MEETKGENIIEKYVTKTKEKPRKTSHVGGAFPKKNGIERVYDDLDKKGINKSRDY